MAVDAHAADAPEADAFVDQFGAVPSSFTRNVLVEMVAGTWTGWVPDAYHHATPQIETYPDRVILTTLQNDSGALSNTDSDARVLFHSITGYPTLFVDGVKKPRSDLELAARLATTTNCGLAIDAQVASAVEVRSHCVNPPQNATTLSVWLVESLVIGPNQESYSNTTMGHTYEGAGDPILNFEHRGVVRDLVTTAAVGDIVDLSMGTVSQTFSVDTGLCQRSAQCQVVAFIAPRRRHRTIPQRKCSFGSRWCLGNLVILAA